MNAFKWISTPRYSLIEFAAGGLAFATSRSFPEPFATAAFFAALVLAGFVSEVIRKSKVLSGGEDA